MWVEKETKMNKTSHLKTVVSKSEWLCDSHVGGGAVFNRSHVRLFAMYSHHPLVM